MKDLILPTELEVDEYITIHKAGSFTTKYLYLKRINLSKDWFNSEYYNIKELDNVITIKKCYLDTVKKSIKYSKNHTFPLITYLEPGKYFVDVEITEDELIIKLK